MGSIRPWRPGRTASLTHHHFQTLRSVSIDAMQLDAGAAVRATPTILRPRVYIFSRLHTRTFLRRNLVCRPPQTIGGVSPHEKAQQLSLSPYCIKSLDKGVPHR